MKQIAFITCSILLCINTSFAKKGDPILKGSFSGTITDGGSNMPVSGASVYIADIKTGTTTNAEGVFLLTNIPEGKHLLEISHIGYTTLAALIDITGDVKKNFVLQHTAVENDAVILTGAGAATQLKRSPFQVSLIKKDELIQSSAANIIEALTKQPGVTTISTGPVISKPVIRGLSYNRVLTINDGVRQEGQQWGDEHGIEIDQASVNKVEILKGPASIIYGSDAMAGVINIITNVPVEKNTVKWNLLSGYQTNNRQRFANASIAGNKNGFNWNMYSSIIAAADYQNRYDGHVFNSKFKQNNAGGYIGYNGNWGYSHLLVSKYDMQAGLTEGDRDMDGFFVKPVAGGGEERVTDTDNKTTTPFIPYQHIRHFKVATDNSFRLGKNRLSLNVGFQRNQREEFGNPDDTNERELFFDLKTITYTAQFHLQEQNGWKTTVGINGMKQQNKNRGEEEIIPEYNLFDIGGYVYAQKNYDKLTLSSGARFDRRHIDAKNLLDGTAIKGTAFKKSFSNFSGSIGVATQLTQQLNLKLNIARGFRAPSIPELASNGAHEGTIRYEYGDNNLKSETSWQFDAGAAFNTEHVSFNVSAFYNHFNNFIFYSKLRNASGTDSLVTVDGEDLTAFKYNQRAATISGVEASIDFHPHPLDWLHVENTFSLTKGRFAEAVDGSVNIPFMPAARLLSELRCNFKTVSKSIANFYAKFEVDNTFSQQQIFSAYNTETTTPGYTLLNAGIGADIVSAKGNTVFSVHFAGSNLTNLAYQNHLSRLKYAAENLATGRMGVFNMGRNFSIKLNIPMVFKIKSA